MTANLACDALQMALWRRGMSRGVIVHSDRGSQYCSAQYQALLRRHDLICSMSGKGNCFDNACAESFFHSLKVEVIHGNRFQTREAMRRTVFEYIAVNYNRIRRSSSIGYLSPESFEAKFAASFGVHDWWARSGQDQLVFLAGIANFLQKSISLEVRFVFV